VDERKQPTLRLRITAAAETALRGGHPWLYADSVREQNREGTTGEIAVVYDRRNKFLAAGLFDASSPIRFRVLQVGKPKVIDRAWWVEQLRAAIARRDGLFDERTTGYRWINGESDGWPGLVLDRYDRTLVLKLYTAAWMPWLETIIPMINASLRPDRILLRLSRNIQAEVRQRHRINDGDLIIGKPLERRVVFLESGLRFEADVIKGQKTGFFLDQRDNRRRVSTLCSGKSVLNAFSFSGGFSVYAARGGASSVTDIDISQHALDAAKRNFALNRDAIKTRCRYEQAQADAFEWLRGDQKFGMIILDPPSLAKREIERAGAIRAYQQLVSLGIQRLGPGGVLLACSCSAHVTAQEFFAAARGAAAKSGRKFEEIATSGHPADHPASFEAAQYLKAIYLRFK
jgi:23S rRNA (cytosine1962-C5)-methyltransferase